MMLVVDTDVIDAHMENLMENLRSPQVSHNHLNKSTDLFTISWITLSELPTSIHNTMNNIFIFFKKLTSKEMIFKGPIKTISGGLSKIKVAHYQATLSGLVRVTIDKDQNSRRQRKPHRCQINQFPHPRLCCRKDNSLGNNDFTVTWQGAFKECIGEVEVSELKYKKKGNYLVGQLFEIVCFIISTQKINFIASFLALGSPVS